MSYFEYGETEINQLKRKCKKLGAAIDRIGPIKRRTMLNPFEALIFHIVGQQISSKAVKTVWNRFTTLIGEVTSSNILAADHSAIQKCGMTTRKVNYMVNISIAAQSGEIDFGTLHLLSDDDIIKKLSALNGVGVWTVEMLLLFSFCRPNVISYGDLAIRTGIMNLYGLKSLPKSQFEKYKKRYSPYNSVASLYLWALSVE